MLARQALYCLSHSASPILCWAFFKIGSCELCAQGWLRTTILRICASQVARITCVVNWALPYSHFKHCWYWFSYYNFLEHCWHLFSSLGTFSLGHPEVWTRIIALHRGLPYAPHRKESAGEYQLIL
jgi:hypothetical protein